MLADPPLAADPPEESSGEEDVPPPGAHTGLSKQLTASMTIGQLSESWFSPGIMEPGLLRVLNCSGETLHKSTQLHQVDVPRMLYFQSCSWSHFNHMKTVLEESTHDAVLTRADEARGPLVSCRLFCSHVPAFRALEQTQRIIGMQSVVNDNLENRIAVLEATVQQLQRQIAALLAQNPVEPETEVEPLPREPSLEEY